MFGSPAPVTRIADGRTPWDVFRDERFLGNSRVDPCSKILKRKLLDRWLSENCDPVHTIVYVGIDWTEEHRFARLRARREVSGWTYRAPLCEPPYVTKREILSAMRSAGVDPPRLYALGFPHNNCGGFCVKAGQAHFLRLLDTMPERYAFHESQEEAMRQMLGRDVSILKDTRGGEKRPLTLRVLRERAEVDRESIDKFDFGGCGCAIDDGEEAA